MIERRENGVRGGTKPRDNEEILLGMDGRQGRGEADSRSCKKSEITSYRHILHEKCTGLRYCGAVVQNVNTLCSWLLLQKTEAVENLLWTQGTRCVDV